MAHQRAQPVIWQLCTDVKKLNPERSCCLWSSGASSVSSSDCLLDPLESSHHHLFQGFLCRLFEDMDTWVKIWWWSTCVLTIHYLLLLVLMFCTFLCDYFFCVASLSLSLWMQISAGMLLIFFQLIKCLWGRRAHEVWCVSFEHKLHAASNFTLQFTVIPIINGSVKELLILFSKSEKKVFSKFPENWKEEGLLSKPWNWWKNKQLLPLCCQIYWITFAKPSHSLLFLKRAV